MMKVASLRYGVIFKKAFSQPHIFTAFVKDILGIDIEIDKVETEKSFSPCVGKVDSRFDLFAEDKKNRLIVDIQHKRYADHYDRFLHYHCVALLEQISSPANYKPDMDVYTIVVLTSGDKYKTDIAITDFRPQRLDGSYIPENKHKIIHLCPKYVNEQTPEPLREWLMAIDDSLDNRVDETDYQKDSIQEIFTCIQEDNTSPQEYARMKDEYSDEEYIQEERLKAEVKGKKEGEREQKITIAQALLKEGMDLNLVAKTTGLSIKSLKDMGDKS